MTIHFGVKGDAFKPQMFRAEWAGWAKWIGDDYSFQAAEAGHPHWQIDALDSLPEQEVADRAAMWRELLRGDAADQVQDFAPRLDDGGVRDIVTAQKLSRIHFASAAAWWKGPPHDAHAHSPARLADIRNWLGHSLAYIATELGRLQVA